MSASLRPHGLWPARLPCPWNFPGKNTGVGCRPLHQGPSWARGRTRISCTAGRLPSEPAGKPRNVCVAPIACRWPSRSAHEASSTGSWPCRLVFGCFLAEPRVPEQVPSVLWTQHAVTQVCVFAHTPSYAWSAFFPFVPWSQLILWDSPGDFSPLPPWPQVFRDGGPSPRFCCCNLHIITGSTGLPSMKQNHWQHFRCMFFQHWK